MVTKAELILGILRYFEGYVLTHDELCGMLWGDSYKRRNQLAVHIKQARERLESNERIVTIWGVGYKLQKEDA